MGVLVVGWCELGVWVARDPEYCRDGWVKLWAGWCGSEILLILAMGGLSLGGLVTVGVGRARPGLSW